MKRSLLWCNDSLQVSKLTFFTKSSSLSVVTAFLLPNKMKFHTTQSSIINPLALGGLTSAPVVFRLQREGESEEGKKQSFWTSAAINLRKGERVGEQPDQPRGRRSFGKESSVPSLHPSFLSTLGIEMGFCSQP